MRWIAVPLFTLATAFAPCAFAADAAKDIPSPVEKPLAVLDALRANDAEALAEAASGRPSDVIARSHNLLRVMEVELAQRPFLAGDSVTLADIANYSYVAHVPEGTVSLEPYPQVRQWLRRLEALPGFVPMVASPIGLAA